MIDNLVQSICSFAEKITWHNEDYDSKFPVLELDAITNEFDRIPAEDIIVAIEILKVQGIVTDYDTQNVTFNAEKL